MDGEATSCASLDMVALHRFLDEGFAHLEDLAERAEMFPERVEQRKREVGSFSGWGSEDFRPGDAMLAGHPRRRPHNHRSGAR